MLAKNKAQETWREASVPLNENAPTTIYFRDTEPNHIVITNPTSNTIYVSTSSNVSQNNHEMQVPSGGTKMFAKPQGMRSIYVWHADNIIENIPIVSFYDEFNPQNIAQTQETVNTQNVTGTVDVATMPALPGGTNNIGSVNVAELPALSPGTANIGHVNVDTLPTVDVGTLPELPAGTNTIGTVNQKALPGTVLSVPSAAITATVTSADLPVGDFKELAIDVDLTALTGTTPSYTLQINRKGADGVYYPIYTGSAETATAMLSLTLGVGASTNVGFGDTLQVVETIAGTTPSITRSMSIIGK